MSEFIVSARKYRPSTFRSVVGQQSITATLKNALSSGKMGHAYLFTGPRGVGKTSCARIFAKTINCSQLSADHEPCNECESCESFNQNRSYNIHELDAASNNSVDDIRLITEKVRIKPQLGQYSVYIIDEVHMLSTAAFNAFLKTLEEPPEHAIFILATTEKHKILPTILSRCQIFDFNRITVEDAAKHLAYVAQQENITAEPEALNVIAQKADGGMRDALSMFDQIVSFSSGQVTYDNVIENLNVLDYDYYFKIVDALFAADISQSFLLFNEILENGFDGHHFIAGLASHLRDLMVCKDTATIQLLEVGASIKERYKEQAQLCSVLWIFKAIEIANRTDLNYKTSQNKRLQVELALMQIAQIHAVQQQAQAAPTPPPVAKVSAPPQNQTVATSTTGTAQQNTAQNNAPEKTSTAYSQKQTAPAVNQVEESPLQTPAATPSGERKRKSSLSISALKNQGTTVETGEKAPIAQEPGTEVTEQQNFDEAQLHQAWQTFSESFIKSPRMTTFFNTNKPTLLDNFQIQIAVNNKLQRESIENQLDKLQNFLRQQLRNGALQIVFKEAAATAQQKVFTPEDKLKFLLEKNPKMVELKNKFMLDFN